MNDRRKTKAELISELKALRAELQHSGGRSAAGARPLVGTGTAQSGGDRLSAALHHADAVLILLDVDGIVLSVEGRLLDALGLDGSAFVGRSLPEYHAGRPDVQETLRRGLAGEHGQYTSRHQGHAFDCFVNPVHDDGGRLSGVIIVAIDVTERQQVEQSLRESQERYRLLVENQTDLFIKFDLDWRVEYASPSYCATFGIEENGLVGQSFLHLIHDVDRERVLCSLRSALAPPYRTRHDEQALTTNGWRWFSWHAQAVLDAAGTPAAIVSVGHDIHEQKMAEMALGESNQRYRQLFSTMREGFALHEIIFDDAGRPCDYRFLQANPAFEEMTGLRASEVVGRTVLELLPETEKEWVERYGEVALTGRPARFELFSGSLGRHFEVSAYSPRPRQFACVFRDITQRVVDEEALRESEERFRGIADNLAAGIAFCSPTEDGNDFTIRSLNPAAIRRAGNDTSRYVGKTIQCALPILSGTGFRDALRRVWDSGDAERFPIILRNGQDLAAWFDTFVCRLSVGELVVVFEDQTREHRSQEEAAQRGKQLQSIFTAAPIGIGLIRESRVVTANERLIEMLGCRPEDLVGQPPHRFLPKEVIVDIREQIVHHGTGSLETRLKRGDGTQRDVLLGATPFDPADHTKGIAFTVLDITQRKQTEARARLEQQVLAALSAGKSQRDTIRCILETIQHHTGVDAIGLRLRDGEDYPYYLYSGLQEQFVMAENELCCRDAGGRVICEDSGRARLACLCGAVLSGRTNAELPCFTEYGSFWTNNSVDLLSSQDAASVRDLRGRCPREGYRSMALIPLVCEDETVALLQLNDRRAGRFTESDIAFYEELGTTIGVSIARERDREALRRNEERLHEILDSIGAGVLAIDGETDAVLYANPAAAELLRTHRSELLGQQAPVVAELAAGDTLRAGGSPAALLMTSDGEAIPVLRTISTTEIDGRKCLLESFIDLTDLRDSQREREELEARLQCSQRLEAIGTLAGGIAHDFNNILYAILGFAELALDDCPLDSDLRDNLLEITKSGHRARDIIHQILTFSRQAEEEKMTLRLQSVVKEVAKLLRSSIPASIAIHTEVDNDAPCVLANPGQMHQVLMNLCTNAYQSMRDMAQNADATSRPSEIHVSLFPHTLSPTEARFFPGLQPGRHVELRVKDTGPGIPREVLEHIFEPYFTTKAKERGTGLGLAIVSGIVQSHGGAITVDSEESVGTTFRIILPATASTEEHGETEYGARTPVCGTERILFVDDEAAIRHLACQSLPTYGYSVTTASEGKQVLDLLRESPDSFDLLVTDLTMPGMSGLELAREALLVRPDLPIILSTGFADAVDKGVAMAHGIREIALKPVTPAELAQRIQQVLHPSRAQS